MVGRLADVADLFEQHSQDLRLEVAGDRHQGRYQPRELAHFVYGAGRYATARETLN